jgi:uncharacterized protein
LIPPYEVYYEDQLIANKGGTMSKEKENLETVRRLFKAVEERDPELALAGVLAAYHPEIVIREAESLPYGGEYRGIEGATEVSLGYHATWAELQPAGETGLDATFLASGDHVVAFWRQKGVSKSGKRFDMPAVSVYKMRNGKIVESQMFHADTAAIVQFLNEA